MGKIIGIDLGTHNSVAGVLDGPQPRVLESREGQPEIRSVVSIKQRKKGGNAEVLTGDTAIANWALNPKNTIVAVKRLMGRGIRDPQVQKIRERVLYEIVEPSDGTQDSVRVIMGGREYSPAEISAMILRKIKEDAEHRLGTEVTHAVVTVPAYFSQVQKKATRQATFEAGMKLIQLLEEPTAAAIAFGMDAREAEPKPKTIVVYDLGGGTFDVSVMLMSGGTFAPMSLQGNMWLGGVDFDQVIVDRMLAYVEDEYGVNRSTFSSHPRVLARLQQVAQKAKETLSSSQSADIVVDGLYQDDDGNLIDLEMEVTVEEFEKAIEPLVSEAQQLTQKAVEKAHLAPEDVDYVIMAGNSSRIPLVQRSMEALFPPVVGEGEKKPRVLNTVPPKLSVAMGAAIIAARIGARMVCQAPHPDNREKECGHVNEDGASMCADCGQPLTLEIQQPVASESGGDVAKIPFEIEPPHGIAPFNYGTQSDDDRFNLFIREGDPCPTAEPKTQVFYTSVPNQRMISIPVYGGDDLAKASSNEKQGEAFAILPAGLAKRTPVRIKLELDRDGIFHLSAHLEDGTDLKPWVVEGERDAKAIDKIHKAEQIVGQKTPVVSPEERKQFEAARSRALDRMRAKDFDGALREADQLVELAEQAGSGVADDLVANARAAINFVEFIQQNYGWALTPSDVTRLNEVVKWLSAGLASGANEDLSQGLAALDRALQALSPMVSTLLTIRRVIAGTIGAQDPALAADLERRFSGLERGLASGAPGVVEQMDAFIAELNDILKRSGAGIECPNGHVVPVGERYCPSPGCGFDVTRLVSGPGGSGEFRSL